MNFLNNLTELLKEKNMSRRELANKIGISPSTINSWYSRGCENVTLINLNKIARFFDITLDELVYNNEKSDVDVVSFSSKYYSKADIEFIKSMQTLINDYKSNMENELNAKVKRIFYRRNRYNLNLEKYILTDNVHSYIKQIENIDSWKAKKLDDLRKRDIYKDLYKELNKSDIEKYLEQIKGEKK